MKTTEKFTGKADIYSKYRPTYPKEFVDDLYKVGHINEKSIVADVGSGTGILTQQLLLNGTTVMAVEPNHDMRYIAERDLNKYPNFHSINATAENTTLEDHSIDLITVAQAFHWFNHQEFKIECKRILKPNAKIILVWNSRDYSHRLITDNEQVCKEYCPDFTSFSGGIEETSKAYDAFFKNGIYKIKTFENNLLCDLDSFIGRNLSSSFAPKEDDKTYPAFMKALTALFHHYSKNGILILPYITRCYIGTV